MTEAVGLCARCVNARHIISAKGSTFWLCRKAEDDPRFAKYPRLPVLRCHGFEDQGGLPSPRRESEGHG